MSPAGHKGQPFTFETQPHIKWKSKEEYMINNANVTKEHLETGASFQKIGASFQKIGIKLSVVVGSTGSSNV